MKGKDDLAEIIVRVVHTVAEEEGVDPLELPPFGSVVDVGILEESVDSGHVDGGPEFEYLGRTFVLGDNGAITKVDRLP